MNTKLTNTQVLLNNYHSRIEEIRESSNVDCLCISEQIEIDIELSTGGPADGFKLYLDRHTRQPLSGFYYYADWGWYEEESLRPYELDMVAASFGFL